MSKRDRRICALLFAAVWCPMMAGVWWVATVMTQAMVGAVLVLNNVALEPVISDIPSSRQTAVFAGIALAGLVLGCLGCRYGPVLMPPPPPPPPPLS